MEARGPRLAALTIDLDALPHYHRIHGLPPPPADGPDPVYGRAMERFGELCARLGLPGTLFCVGEDLRRPGVAARARAVADAGHELANHTLSHDYALTRRAPDVVRREVQGGADAIAAITGRPPLGFRAPGYTLSRALLAAVAESGHRYDSSVFPAAPYYLAKAAVMGALALRGSPSGAVLDRPRVLLAPRSPYRPRAHEPYAAGGPPGGLVELPIATGLLAFPVIGTFVATLPHGVVRALAAPAAHRPLLVLELHGVDLLDASDASPALAARQRDLRVPAGVKLARLERFVRALDREWMTAGDAAARVAAW